MQIAGPLHEVASPAVELDRRDLLGDVEAGTTAMNGRPSRRAKYASDTAVDPLEASMTGAPSRSQPLESA